MAEDQTTKGQNDAGQNASDGGQQSSGQRTFTQEELTAILTERLNRAKGAAVGDLLKELGLEARRPQGGDPTAARGGQRLQE